MKQVASASFRSSATEMAASLAQGQTSSVEICERLLDRIADEDADIKAWIHLNRDATLRDAAAADERRSSGSFLSAFDGIPIGIKDNIDTADFPTEMGSPIHAGRQPHVDAAVVRQLKNLGLVVLGKTITTPFGMNDYAPTRNPIDPQHTLGASSVGSAAAVAASMVPMTLNTQNTSSTTRPASYAGVFAFKPTHGLLQLAGTLALSPPVTSHAFMARTLTDLLGLAGCLLPQLMSASSEKTWSFAVVKGPWWERADKTAAHGFETFAAENRIDGSVTLPDAFNGAFDAHHALIAGDMAVTLTEEDAAHRNALPDEAVAWIAQGREMSAVDYITALRLRDTLYGALDEAMGEADVLVTLSTPGPPPRIKDGLGDGAFSMPWTFCGCPTLSLPLLQTPCGLPIGVQLIGRRRADAVLFHAAAALLAKVGSGLAPDRVAAP